MEFDDVTGRIVRCIEYDCPYSRGGLNRSDIITILYAVPDDKEGVTDKEDLSRYSRKELVTMMKNSLYGEEELEDSDENSQPPRFQIIGHDGCPYCRKAKEITGVTEYIDTPPPGAYVPDNYRYIPKIFENGVFIGGLDELMKCKDHRKCPEYSKY